MQRPQFGLVHFLTSHVSFEVNSAFVSKRFRLHGRRFHFKILYFDKMFLIFSSSCKIGILSISTRNISGSLGLYVDTGLLKEISKKLTTLIKEVKDMNSNLNDLKEQTVAKTVVPVADDNGDPLRETLGQIENYFERISSQQPEAAATQEPITTNLLIEEKALRIKSRMSNMWDNNLKARRLAYWQSYRNKNIANKYAEWQELDLVIVPQWLQMKYIPNEPENFTKKREKQVLDNFKTEVEILNLRQQNQEEKYQGTDNKMKEELSKLATGERRNALLKLCDDDCKRNEAAGRRKMPLGS